MYRTRDGRFSLSYQLRREINTLTSVDLPSEVEISLDGIAIRVVVEDDRVFVETFDSRKAIFPERELLIQFPRDKEGRLS